MCLIECGAEARRHRSQCIDFYAARLRRIGHLRETTHTAANARRIGVGLDAEYRPTALPIKTDLAAAQYT